MDTTMIPASEKQENFIRDLLATRVLDQAYADELLDRLESNTLDKTYASQAIDTMLKAPKQAGTSPFQKLLATVPKSKYAVTAEELEFTSADDNFKDTIVFLEVREFKGTLYMRQLHGSLGSFVRSKLSKNSIEAIVKVIAKDPYAYARLFGEHFTCCGSCGAVLTDDRSRELMLGPECRKKFEYSGI